MADNAEKIIARYKVARAAMLTNDQLLLDSLLVAAGYTLGGDMPGSSAAIMIAIKRLFPDANITEIV